MLICLSINLAGRVVIAIRKSAVVIAFAVVTAFAQAASAQSTLQSPNATVNDADKSRHGQGGTAPGAGTQGHASVPNPTVNDGLNPKNGVQAGQTGEAATASHSAVPNPTVKDGLNPRKDGVLPQK
jgi:putative alpha-1,2-mannosidase